MGDEKGAAPAAGSLTGKPTMLEYIRGSVFKYIITIALPALLFIMMTFYMGMFCFALLALPLLAVVFFWLFKIGKLWHQIALGALLLAVASLSMAAIVTATYVGEAVPINSSDGVFVDGMVTPYTGALDTVYNFSVTIEHPASYVSVRVVIYDPYGTGFQNITMIQNSVDATNSTRDFYVNKQVLGPVNVFYFNATIDGTWHESLGTYGPVASDALSIYGILAWSWLMYVFGFCFMQFIVMLLFLRMSGKSKEAREKMLKEYKMKKEEALVGGKDEKGGSEAKEESPGAGDGDTFVCSECGSEVKSTAKYCPNCGEPFDEDEGDGDKSATEKK